MISHVKFVSIPTTDQDRALAFWTERVWLRVLTDQPLDETQRRIELRVGSSETRIVLFRFNGNGWQPGRRVQRRVRVRQPGLKELVRESSASRWAVPYDFRRILAMRELCAAGLAASVLACGSPMSRHPEASSGASSQTQSLTDYLNGEFEEELARQPEWATAMGRKDNYGKLDDRSEMAQQIELEWRRQSVQQMKALFDRSQLNAEDQTSFDMWATELDDAELRAKFRRHAYIFGYRGPHTDVPNLLITYHKVDEASDMAAYTARLIALATVLDQAS